MPEQGSPDGTDATRRTTPAVRRRTRDCRTAELVGVEAVAGADDLNTRRIYAVTVRGNLPADLGECVSRMHVSALAVTPGDHIDERR